MKSWSVDWQHNLFPRGRLTAIQGKTFEISGWRVVRSGWSVSFACFAHEYCITSSVHAYVPIPIMLLEFQCSNQGFLSPSCADINCHRQFDEQCRSTDFVQICKGLFFGNNFPYIQLKLQCKSSSISGRVLIVVFNNSTYQWDITSNTWASYFSPVYANHLVMTLTYPENICYTGESS